MIKMSAHFICKSGFGIKSNGGREYTSEAWDLSEAEALSLIGGTIFFHESKNDRSYFGGTVMKFESIKSNAVHENRIKFYLTPSIEAKGQSWNGKTHSMAWFSGIIKSE